MRVRVPRAFTCPACAARIPVPHAGVVPAFKYVSRMRPSGLARRSAETCLTLGFNAGGVRRPEHVSDVGGQSLTSVVRSHDNATITYAGTRPASVYVYRMKATCRACGPVAMPAGSAVIIMHARYAFTCPFVLRMRGTYPGPACGCGSSIQMLVVKFKSLTRVVRSHDNATIMYVGTRPACVPRASGQVALVQRKVLMHACMRFRVPHACVYVFTCPACGLRPPHARHISRSRMRVWSAVSR
ncbi:hypothetical protein R1sor_019653 [Riccia sorocarpa]|uniref:Uncharacterized protein n=1 Tax=Riccia sorocarpa TaxID=122646 RepID=A0ABD3IDS3_9MARC